MPSYMAYRLIDGRYGPDRALKGKVLGIEIHLRGPYPIWDIAQHLIRAVHPHPALAERIGKHGQETGGNGLMHKERLRRIAGGRL